MRDSKIRTKGAQEIAGLTAENIYQSSIRIEEDSARKTLWDSLTEEEKNDIIEVDGHKYIRKIYEAKR